MDDEVEQNLGSEVVIQAGNAPYNPLDMVDHSKLELLTTVLKGGHNVYINWIYNYSFILLFYFVKPNNLLSNYIGFTGSTLFSDTSRLTTCFLASL